MKIGITFDLKADQPAPVGAPDDFQEEFDSPVTIEAIASVLRDLGHDVVKLGNGRKLLERLLADPPELVFNFAEGQGVGRSREARVPAVLEMLDIPYTGSDPLTLAATLDKDCAKRLVSSYGVQVPHGVVITENEGAEAIRAVHSANFPVIVKPAWEGSSKGIRNHCLVEKPDKLGAIVEEMRRDYLQPILIEEYINGDELTVGMVGNDPPHIIGIMKVLPARPTEKFVYSLEVKRDYLRQVRYECPAQLGLAETEAVRQAAFTSFRVLGCRDVARVDFRLRDGVPYFLEVNPLPGLNPDSSDLVILSKAIGWTYPQLISSILQAALQRQAS